MPTYFVADFETNTTAPTYVWGYGIVQIDNLDNIVFGSSLVDFLDNTEDKGVYFFHNLRFDMSFILDYLLKHGYEHTQERKLKPLQFSSIITEQRLVYQLKFLWNGNLVELRDSMKKLPFSVSKIGKDFLHELAEKKGKIDYTLHREEGAELTEKDKEYIRKDIVIVAKALAFLFKKGMTSLTTGADTLKKYKVQFGKKFEKMFPVLDYKIHMEIKPSYKGGYAHIKKGCAGVEYNEPGQVYDVNSLYPDRMVRCVYPYGQPIYFEGAYQKDKYYPLYIINFNVMFSIRPGFLPTVQIKNNSFYANNEFIEESDGLVNMSMTSVDLELFQEHYYIHEIHFISGFKFKQCTGIFDDYILPLYEQKMIAEGAEQALIKLLLNSLYGKFAKNPNTTTLRPTLDNDIVVYREKLPEISDTVYLPVGTFITAHARYKTITTAQRLYNQFIYADTDSLHITGQAPPWLRVHKTELGGWKLENNWTKAKFLRPKRYIEIGDDKTVLKCCGMSDRAKNCSGCPEINHCEYDKANCDILNKNDYGVTWDNFIRGTQYSGNLKSKTVPGGIILINNTFVLD